MNNIYSVLHANDYKGAVVDFKRLHPRDEVHINRFIRELASKLHRTGMEVMIAVPPMRGKRLPTRQRMTTKLF